MRHLKTLLTVLGAVTVLVLAGNTVALATTGHAFILGQSNSAKTITSLTRTKSGPALKVTTKRSSNPPFAVNGHGKVTNLNADLVDGMDSSVLRNHSYLFTKDVGTPASGFELTVPVPVGTYVFNYSTFMIGGSGNVFCEIARGNGSTLTFSGITQFTAGTSSPGLSGSGLVTKAAGDTILFVCSSAGGNFTTSAGIPAQLVMTPTTVTSTHALRVGASGARVAGK